MRLNQAAWRHKMPRQSYFSYDVKWRRKPLLSAAFAGGPLKNGLALNVFFRFRQRRFRFLRENYSAGIQLEEKQAEC
jgi:hypothetical protein